MYADRVDTWLQTKAYTEKSPEESVTEIGLFIFAPLKLFFKLWRVSFMISWLTFYYICLFPPLRWIPPFSIYRKKSKFNPDNKEELTDGFEAFDDQKEFFTYHPWIIGRKTKSRIYKCSLTDDENQKRISSIIDAAATELREGENVMFLIKDPENISKDTGMVFTETRLIYNLEKQGKLTTSDKGGEVNLPDLGTPEVTKSLSDTVSINFGELKLGCLKFFKSVDLVREFLIELRKAVQASA